MQHVYRRTSPEPNMFFFVVVVGFTCIVLAERKPLMQKCHCERKKEAGYNAAV